MSPTTVFYKTSKLLSINNIGLTYLSIPPCGTQSDCRGPVLGIFEVAFPVSPVHARRYQRVTESGKFCLKNVNIASRQLGVKHYFYFYEPERS